MCKSSNQRISKIVWVFVLASGFVLYLGSSSPAATYNVNPGESIQIAIDGASYGDTVYVTAGTYIEIITLKNGVAVIGEVIGDEPDNTIINGNNIYTVVSSSGCDPNTVLSGFTITGGVAYGGGGMLNINYSSPTVTNCIFSWNDADYGGGMLNYESNPTVTNCTFTDNSAEYGGGMHNEGSNPTVTNCIFCLNLANWGGGMYNYNSSSPTVTNCTFSENQAFIAGNGDGMGNELGSYPTITNCIFWNGIWGTMGQIYSDFHPLNVSYSDVQGGYDGPNNIDADPLFLNPMAVDLRLSSSSSPCVDTGNNGAVTEANDLAGNPRVVDGDANDTAIVDMGAYELPPSRIHNITQDIWYGPYGTIQTAINGANNGDEIEVLPGTFNEAINFIGRAITLRSSDPNDPNIVAATVIDGTGNYHVVQCVTGEGPNTVLSGFTITGGNANGSYPDSAGGGMFNSGSSPTVTNCTFSGNSAYDYGGGMYNYGGSPTVTNCTFSGNSAYSAYNYGGGIYNEESSPTVTNCMFSGNSAYAGGGMLNYESNPTVTNCTFTDNSADGGGGMCNGYDNPTVTNCTFSGNSAYVGGGIYNEESSPTVTNCTFSGNSAYDYGGGMCNAFFSSPTVTNCTFTDNSADYGGGMRNEGSNPTVTNCILWGDEPNEIYNIVGYPNVTYSDVEGGTGQSWFGTGCIDADPYFVNPDSNDFHLLTDSPCLDAGDSTGLWQKGIWKDMDGKLRYVDISGVTDTGIGPVTFVDMGAYELYCSGIAGDDNCDGVVNFKDLAILCNNWLKDFGG